VAYTTIDDPSAYFQTTLWTGNGSARAITNSGNSDLQPDWIWGKNRSGSNAHWLMDTTRGVDKRIISSGSDAEDDPSTAILTAFGSNGFSLGTNTEGNGNGNSYVAWQWKSQGGSTVSNSDGSITSTVQANTTAGFSIISYTGNGSDGATIGHGLNQTPQIFFPKCLSTTTNWEMYYFPTGGTRQYGYLNLTNAFSTWPHNAPSSTIISLSGSGDSNGNGRSNIGYAFHSVQGYSKIGTYTGNGNADGTFVYTGFKPALLITKRTDATSDWRIWDFKRDPENVVDRILYPSANNGEGSETFGDFLSNGFKLRVTTSDYNASGGTYIYMAFAESPFVSSEGVPCTAR